MCGIFSFCTAENIDKMKNQNKISVYAVAKHPSYRKALSQFVDKKRQFREKHKMGVHLFVRLKNICKHSTNR